MVSPQAYVALHDPYTHSRVIEALTTHVSGLTVVDVSEEAHTEEDMCALAKEDSPRLFYLEYEAIPFQSLLRNPENVLANSYCIRKGLIRKAQLSICLRRYLAKHPEGSLKDHIPETWVFQLDRADDLDELLIDECWEVGAALRENEEHDAGSSARSRFLLKPSMTAGGYGIHVIDSENQLRDIMEELHPEVSDEEGDEDDGQGGQLKEYVLQRYISAPLLPPQDPRKFHVRVYVLAVAGIHVYVHREMLALFALSPYAPDAPVDDMNIHLTNTCIQEGKAGFDELSAVRSYWDLPELGVPQDLIDASWGQIKEVIGDVFAAVVAEPAWFQALPNAFEVYGIDILLDEHGSAFFLEANAFPDFGQTGSRLGGIVTRVMADVAKLAIVPWASSHGIKNLPETPVEETGFSLVYSNRLRA